MIDDATPISQVKRVRSCSTEYADDACMLCCSPIVWPTSWADTKRTSSPISSSSNLTPRASSLTAAVCTKNQLRSRFITLWYHWMSLSRISPVRGSCTWGPEAFWIGDAK